MSDDERQDTAPTEGDGQSPAGEPTEADVLGTLQQDNEQLRSRIEQLRAVQEDRQTLQHRLEEAQEANDWLRRRCAELALTHAIDEAAVNLGVSPEAAGVYRSRFACELDGDGEPKIEPNPTELLARELRRSPVLRQSVERGRQDRQAAAVTSGAAELSEANPVELLAALDRKPSRKARFIARHGAQAFLDLAEAARAKGPRDRPA